MPQLIIIILLIVAAVFLVWVLFVAFIRLIGVIIGYSIIVAGLAFLTGIALGLILPMRVLRGSAATEPAIASAEAVRQGQVFKAAPTGASRHFGWDFAWPLYAPYQLERDQAAVILEARDTCATIWQTTRSWWPGGKRWYSTAFFATTWFIVLGIPTVGLLFGIVVGTFLWAALTWVFLMLVTVVQSISLRIMRARENRFMKKNNATVRCTRCYQTTDMPSFRCSNPMCGVIHRDVAPGRLGIRSRICGCEQKLPTTVANASKELVAVCPHCDQDLPMGSGSRRVVVVPVFGSVGAGKTQFLATSATALNEGGSELNAGLSITALSDQAQQFLSSSVHERAANQAPMKTQHEQRPEGYPYLVERPEGEFELHFMDAAGENFVGADGTAELRYLDFSNTLVFLLDPLTIPEVNEELRMSPYAGQIQVAQGATSDAYASVTDRLLNSGEDLSKRKLAIVVTKTDIISHIMPHRQLPQSGAEIRDWLIDNGEDRLVTRFELDYSDVSYFAVASTELNPASHPTHPMQVIDWAVTRQGGTSVFPAATVTPGQSEPAGEHTKAEVGA